MQRALEMEVGLSSEQQEEFLVVDDSSYNIYEERYVSSSYPELRTSHKVHEVQVNVNIQSLLAAKSESRISRGNSYSARSIGADSTHTIYVSSPDSEEEQPLQQIGLPSGRDFVTKEVALDGSLRLHVWCWRNREYVRNSKLQAFESYLSSHGVDVRKFGCGSQKTLFQFYEEVRERQESSLEEVVTESSGEKRLVELQRVVELLKIKLIAKVDRRKRILYSPSHVLADGTKRNVNQLLAGKIRKGDDWRKAAQITLSSQLGVPAHVQTECFKIDEGREAYKEEIKPSEGYAGLSTLYKTRTISVHVIDPDHPEMERLGLPMYGDFITKEGELEMRKGGRLHVWTWQPAGAEEEREERMDDREETDNVFVDTAFGELSRRLRDAKHLLHDASHHPQIETIGLHEPVMQALEKIRRCIESLSDIDKTLSEVNVIGKRGRASDTNLSADGNSSTSRIVDFITANFTRSSPELAGETAVHGNSNSDLPSIRTSRKSSTWASLASSASDAISGSKLLQDIQDNLEEWGLDFFETQQNTVHVLESYGEVVLVPMCHTSLNCDREATRGFLKKVAALYYNNHYHNAIHATQVCHSAGWLTRMLGLSDEQSGIETTAFVIAALCHDVKHFGRNNAFCVSTAHALAVLYNDMRVLENMHTATTFELLSGGGSNEANLLRDLSRQDKASIRSQIIEYILATDMSEHFEIISKFRVKRENPDFCVASNETDRRFVARMCIKAGDIGHSALPWELHEKWSVRVMQEFFQQGDEERSLNLPVSALCDRNNVGDVGRSQKGFLEFVCLPLFEELSKFEAPSYDEDDEEESRIERLATSGSKSNRTTRATSVVSSSDETRHQVRRQCTQCLKDNAKRWVEDATASERVLVLLQIKTENGV